MNPKLINAIEKAWKYRARVQQYGKPKSAKYQLAQTEFFIGAMAAIEFANPGNAMPPRWVVGIMCGDDLGAKPPLAEM